MLHNCLIHLAVDGDPETVDKLLAKICAATEKQKGVAFALATKAPSLTRAAQKAKVETPAPEELFR